MMLSHVWRTSARSGGNGQCVEVRLTGAAVQIRDSKDRSGPVLDIPPAGWRCFVRELKTDRRH